MVSYRIGCTVWEREESMMTLRFWPEGIELPFFEMGMTLRRRLGDRQSRV